MIGYVCCFFCGFCVVNYFVGLFWWCVSYDFVIWFFWVICGFLVWSVFLLFSIGRPFFVSVLQSVFLFLSWCGLVWYGFVR